MSQPIVNSKFEHIKELNKYSKSYAFRSIKSLHPTKQVKSDPDSLNYELVEITCSIEFGLNGCIANEIGLCNHCCFTIYNCTSITFGL